MFAISHKIDFLFNCIDFHVSTTMVNSNVPTDNSKKDVAITAAEHGNVDKAPASKLPDWKFMVRRHLAPGFD